MLDYAVIMAIVIIAGAAAAVAIALWQAERLRKKLHIEVTNRGNVRSRYELRAEDPNGALEFRFSLDGDALPQRRFVATDQAAASQTGPPSIPGQAGEGPEVRQKVAKASGIGSAISSGLMTVGMLLPRSIGAPLTRAASTMQSGKMRAQQVQRVPTQLAEAKARVAPGQTAKPQAELAAPAVPGTVETPYVGPTETLKVDVQVRATKPGAVQQYPFSISSRSVEQKDAPWVIEQSSATILASSGLSRYMPYLVVLVVAVAILAIVVWFAITSGMS